MKPWRQIATPYDDVLSGTFQQADFAADLTAVVAGTAPSQYQDAVQFFDRTYITEGMRILLAEVAKRLGGVGGEPVVQLQTAFGGGKTHTMMAVYHLACRTAPLSALTGLTAVAETAGVRDIPNARVVVLDGNNLSPGQPWKRDGRLIRTLWGEMAWQLGGEAAYERIRLSDEQGTSPGKESLQALLAAHAPCVILVDELVAYIRQFQDGTPLSGGTLGGNLSFVQALTEAVKQVQGAILLASLPESDMEAGDAQGIKALRALEQVFGRVQAIWKPVGTEESFEIVRRRLFKPIQSTGERDEVCRAFADIYRSEAARMPTETQEARYFDRMAKAYPLHPELLDRIYEDWSSIEGFQRTRGVLKLMAQVVYRLWRDGNSDAMILPGSVPLYDSACRNELLRTLSPGWEPVIEGDIDGDRAETTDLETEESIFGQVKAARRVARALFMGSAPASVGHKSTTRGLDKSRVLLGVLEPGQTAPLYIDALNRLANRLHYLNVSGDRSRDDTRFWFDTRANLRREMEDRKRGFDDATAVRPLIRQAVQKQLVGLSAADGVHVFASTGDVPDDSSLRLVVLSLYQACAKESPKAAVDAVLGYIKQHGDRPRLNRNRLLFLAPDVALIGRVTEAARTVLAWSSIVQDAREGRLNVDRAQERQAVREQDMAERVLDVTIKEAFRWALCPRQDDPRSSTPEVEAILLNTGGKTLAEEFARVCIDNEWVIGTWSPVHLRKELAGLYWKPSQEAVRGEQFWEDTLRYVYLPRLRSRAVLESAIRRGAASRDFFGTAVGNGNGRYEGFALGGGGEVELDDTLVLIEPRAAAEYEAKLAAAASVAVNVDPAVAVEVPSTAPSDGQSNSSGNRATSSNGAPQATPTGPTYRRFVGSVTVDPVAAKRALIMLVEELIVHLAKDPNADVQLSLEIDAKFPTGVSEQLRRIVSENAVALKMSVASWEE